MSDEQFPVVGIGASAGGLEALREFVNAIPTDSGMAYVIVQHLAPDHPSIMDQLLAHDAKVPVAKIEDGQLLKPNIVYVIPSGHELTVHNGRFRLHDVGRERGVRMVIDRFFISLAEEYGHRAHCIVLSGTGTDGTTGLRAIKAAGGVAMAQESKSAKFSGMPDNAAATGLVDFVLKPHRMPLRLQEIEQHRGKVQAESVGKSLQDEVTQKLDQILALLAEEGHDFTTYKPGTLVRRIERRMTILRQRTVDGFIDRLTDDKEERDRLLQDFLIGVTRFFRDEDSFESLAKSVIAPLVKTRQRLRIWVPGCATGEEAYSIAILLAEQLEAARVSIPVQIFGTDIDISALNHARSGLYSAQALEGLDASSRQQVLCFRGRQKTHRAATARDVCLRPSQSYRRSAVFAARPDFVPKRPDLSECGCAARRYPAFSLRLVERRISCSSDRLNRLDRTSDCSKHSTRTIGFSFATTRTRAIIPALRIGRSAPSAARRTRARRRRCRSTQFRRKRWATVISKARSNNRSCVRTLRRTWSLAGAAKSFIYPRIWLRTSVRRAEHRLPRSTSSLCASSGFRRGRPSRRRRTRRHGSSRTTSSSPSATSSTLSTWSPSRSRSRIT
jgi:hypothetical protein